MNNIYHFVKTTLGWFEIGIENQSQQLNQVSFLKDINANHKTLEQTNGEEKKIVLSIESQLQEYINGDRKTFKLESSLNWLQNEEFQNDEKHIGTPFQKRVWRTLLTIPYGSVVSYSDVAKKINQPNSVRAVANAIGANPILIVIPCHRVIRKNGQLGGFSAGLDLKKKLIQIEKSVIS